METDKYISKMNGTIVFVKGYRASVRRHVETPNAPVSTVPTSKLLRTTGPINRLL